MRDITLEELLAAGCHFGHQVNRRNPRADEYIFEARAGVNIIDLGKTREGLLKAAEYIKNLSARGGSIIVVGTKKQAASIVESEVARAREAGTQNIHFMTYRWIGGILTNFSEVSKNFKKLADIEKILATDSPEYTKREKLLFEREKQKLLNLYRGVVDLKGSPDALFVVDTHLERTAVNEGRREHVTIVGITDTNADPSIIDYPIPANDDAVGSLQLITSYIIDAWIEGSKRKAESIKGEEENSESKIQSLDLKEEKVKSQKSKVKSAGKKPKVSPKEK